MSQEVPNESQRLSVMFDDGWLMCRWCGLMDWRRCDEVRLVSESGEMGGTSGLACTKSPLRLLHMPHTQPSTVSQSLVCISMLLSKASNEGLQVKKCDSGSGAQ